MRKYFLFLIFLAAIFFSTPVKAQDGSELYVIVLWDKDGDGLEEGVGPGVPVYVRESGATQRFVNYTDQNSSAGFLVDEGTTYLIEATPPQTRLFFVWVCFSQRHIDEPTEYVVLTCVEKFFIRIPLISDWG